MCFSDYEKIILFVKNKGINSSNFCKKANLPSAYLSSLRTYKNNLTTITLSKISEAFPDFDVVGFIISQTAEQWQACLAATPPPPAILDKNQITERLLTFFKELEVDGDTLGSKTGLSISYITSIKRKKTAISSSTLRSILAGFPQLNPHWLIIGEGKMIKDPQKHNSQENAQLIQEINNLQQQIITLEQEKQALMTQLTDKSESIKPAQMQKMVGSVQGYDEKIQDWRFKLQQLWNKYTFNRLGK